MAKEKNQGRGQYGEVVARLEGIVAGLEGGQLSLEESLERFAEGIALVKQGESILQDAEKRIEQLLSEDGRTATLKMVESEEVSTGGQSPVRARVAAPPIVDDDDVPF